MGSLRQRSSGQLSAVNSSLSCIVPGAKCTDTLANDDGVQAWMFTAGQDSGVLKRWPAHRVARAGPQVGAEIRAAAVFGAILDEPSPLMALMLQQSADPRGSALSVYPYAGPSAEQMLKTQWVHLTQQQREPLCKKLAISGLKVIQMLESVPREFGGHKLHRDGKLGNWCYNQEGDFFVCIDFGGFCSASLADWFSIVDIRYVDSCFGLTLDSSDASTSPVLRMMDDLDAWRLCTTPSLDMFLLALAVIELYLGRLPADIDYHNYGPERLGEYLAVLCNYQWPDCPELTDVSWPMMSFLLWCLAQNPAKRPGTAAEALQHEWLADQVPAVEEAVAEAAPAWAATNNRLRGALAGWHASPAQTAAPLDSSNASSSNEASRCSPAGYTADSSEQLLPGHNNSSGSSSMACTTPAAASEPAGDAASSAASSCSEGSLLLVGDSSANSPDNCTNATACQQQGPAAAAANIESSSPADCAAGSSEQLWPGGASSGGSSTACSIPLAASNSLGVAVASPISWTGEALLLPGGNSSISSPECCTNAACQQQNPAAADSSNNSESSTPAGCTADTSEQLLPGHANSSGISVACTNPLASSDPVADAAGDPVNSVSRAVLLLDGDSSISFPECFSNAQCQQQHLAAVAKGSNASSDSRETSCCPIGCTAHSSEQLRVAYSSSSSESRGSSSVACIHPKASSKLARDAAPDPARITDKALLLPDDDSSTGTPECCDNAEVQQRDPVAPVDGSTSSSNSSRPASSCSPDDCTVVLSLGQLRRGHGSGTSGSSTVWTTPRPLSETAANQAMPASSFSEVSRLLDKDSSTTSSSITAACQQLHPDAIVDCSKAGPAYTAVIRPEQLWLGHSSSSSGSMTFITPLAEPEPVGDAAANPLSGAGEALLLLDCNCNATSTQCSDAACQEQDPAVRVDCSISSSSSNAADNCTTAGCTAVVAPEKLQPRFCSGSCIMVATSPSVASDTGGGLSAASSGSSASQAVLLVAGDTSTNMLKGCSETACKQQGRAASCLSNGVLLLTDEHAQQHAATAQCLPLPGPSTNTCSTASTASGAIQKHTVSSSPASSNGQLPYCCCCHSRQRSLVSHPLQQHHPHHPCKWVLRHLVHNVRRVGSRISRLVNVPMQQR